ncbi:hypothetical protein G7B40_003240 [Aetokthonos hydrillicola Thurmond2011]|jgi:hypothetical protein|uniref:Uncharacterized protein n=1 Tax=Aetokthonos hydrillicola Thurmond2011 TaxID=2712845 RepID=A0AAP5M8T3_9CYAN|nr:hypothetical protein [Aetokthonos hydrillicola]MBO3460907.1 hypothetical protein [Aetokthonos hydrillicola CCALA 1050]MBW4586456.1 hypothetical protein [Aetokthonos hydrillicola CCALA 1050]MDR9893599.1 hypothetical protein [Aetokthonos hydrillicola Thurmond2011]
MSIFPFLPNRKRLSQLLIFVVVVVLTIALGSFSTPAKTQTRDKFTWPFASTSIWNMPIGSRARYIPAHIGKAAHFTADLEYFYKLKQGDPLRQVFGPGNWAQGRCTGTQSMGISLPVPDDLIVPDATNHPYYTPNNASAFLMPDGKTLVQLSPLARCQKGGPLYGYRYPDIDIYKDGRGGAHFGSGLSSIGGSIRKGELTNNQPIRHALKVLLWGERYLYYSKSIPGYRWPASNADNGADKLYHGKNPALVQGTLLAIPPKVTLASLRLQTSTAKKLFYALQDYGAYVVDSAAPETHYLAVEKGVPEEFGKTFGYGFDSTSGKFYQDVMKLFSAVYIIENNGPKSIGGGGTPRKPLAPPIGN